VLARSVDDAAFFVGTLARREFGALDAAGRAPLRIGICMTPHWAQTTDASRAALAQAGRLLEAGGAVLADAQFDAAAAGLAEAQVRIMSYEAAAAFVPELHGQPEQLSEPFRAVLAAGLAVSGAEYARQQRVAQHGRAALASIFERFDVLLAPSAPGEAPAGLASTGDPIFSRMWTLLGNPCVGVPVGSGPSGLPIGVTVIGPRWGDERALAVAAQLERALGAR
jgi:Asp-tRNA(Asn)/Glu-tRNA(Gln) amidotransferase A subunit family amidase